MSDQDDPKHPEEPRNQSIYQRLPPFARAGLWATVLFFPLAAWLFVSAPYYPTVDEWVQRHPSEFVRLTAPHQLEVGREPFQLERYASAFQPPSEAIRTHVKQKLEIYLGLHRTPRPRVQVLNLSGDAATGRIRKTLQSWLQRHDLDTTGKTAPQPTRTRLPLTLYYHPDSSAAAFDLLQAFAPYMQGELEAVPSQLISADQLYLTLNRRPLFRTDGATLFLGDSRATASR